VWNDPGETSSRRGRAVTVERIDRPARHRAAARLHPTRRNIPQYGGWAGFGGSFKLPAFLGDGFAAAHHRSGIAPGLSAPSGSPRRAVKRRAEPRIGHSKKEANAMPTLTLKDHTELFYKDWGAGQPLVFHHGWPLSSDDWDTQMLFFLAKGYRVIAHDRRGHGRSTQTWRGNDMDTYADDVAQLASALDLRDAVHIGHSTGGGEVARYVARHGTGRVAKAVLIGAVPPIMVKTPANPGGLPIEVFDGLRAGLAANRAQFFRDVPAGPFYGFNRPDAKVSDGVIDNWWRQGMMGGAKAHYDCIEAFSETDFTDDLKVIEQPVLVMHGEDDQIVPIADSGLLSAKILKNATLKTYPGFPHGMATTHADVINADLSAFITG
jgi:non-heme chloroperoxidase